jgi:hypothetical protein
VLLPLMQIPMGYVIAQHLARRIAQFKSLEAPGVPRTSSTKQLQRTPVARNPQSRITKKNFQKRKMKTHGMAYARSPEIEAMEVKVLRAT